MSRDDSLRNLFAKRAKRQPSPPSFDTVHAAFRGGRSELGTRRHALAALAVAASAVLAARSGWLRPDAEQRVSPNPAVTFATSVPSSSDGVCREQQGIVEPLVCRDAIDPETHREEPAVAELGGFSRSPATLLACGTE